MPLHPPPYTHVQWHDMPMPDASAAVHLAPLQAAGLDQFLALVRFPPGWQRLHAGHYSVDEEFFVISGELHINGLCWQSQQHGFVPAGTLRSDTRSESGCLAYARFFGRPRWVRGDAACAPAAAMTHIADWHRIEPEAFEGGADARLLHAGAMWSTWLLDSWPGQGLSWNAESTDTLRLDNLVHGRGHACMDSATPAGPVLLHSIAATPIASLH